MLSLITPVIKGYGTDKGYEVANNMQQVFGGHGYIEEWGMSQFVRDSRIAMIYEGTNGIQAMDLCGRKLGMNGGATVKAWFDLIDEELAAATANPEIAVIAGRLEKALGHPEETTMSVMKNAMAKHPPETRRRG